MKALLDGIESLRVADGMPGGLTLNDAITILRRVVGEVTEERNTANADALISVYPKLCTNWVKHERVAELREKAPPHMESCYEFYADELNEFAKIVAEEVLRDKRVWIPVSKRLPKLKQKIWTRGTGDYGFAIRKDFVVDQNLLDDFPYLFTHWCELYEDQHPVFSG